MKRPSFQFYPADWLSDSKLRRCTFEEKGVWIDLLCLMHDQEENYGILKWNLKEISRILGCKISLLLSLISKGVLRGADEGKICEELIYIARSGRKSGPPVILIEKQEGPIFYSSRMVIDEHKKRVRGDSPNPSPNHSPNPPFGDGIDAHQTTHQTHHPSRARPSSSSSSSSLKASDPLCVPPYQKSATGRKKSCPIPDDFHLTDPRRKFFTEHGRGDPEMEFQQFRDHALKTGAVYRDWDAAWRTWSRNTLKFSSNGHAKNFPPRKSLMEQVMEANGIPLDSYTGKAVVDAE